ncbi:HAD family hydrolase [Anaerosporobacter faecicola]|uniref:HAD family hydrolase n=1 Tax=Anaerosporobacter faecicola TaxID=2718714 RepID=UPI00143BB025|nr:HAD family hydrolase [Anaerosporobacter faecicola]
MFQTYIFDLYGTLADIHTDEESWEVWSKMRLLYAYHGANYRVEELRTAYEQAVRNAIDFALKVDFEEKLKEDKLKEVKDSSSNEAKKQLVKVEIQILLVFQELFRAKGVSVTNEECTYIAQFFRGLTTSYVKLYKGAKELLKQLKDKKKKVYLLSNAQAAFTRGELMMLGIESYFDGILLSSDTKYAKPDPRFYEQLLRTYQIDPTTAIMIGNDLVADCQGAKNMGLHTCYMHSNLSPIEDQEALNQAKRKQGEKKQDEMDQDKRSQEVIHLVDLGQGINQIADFIVDHTDLNEVADKIIRKS